MDTNLGIGLIPNLPQKGQAIIRGRGAHLTQTNHMHFSFNSLLMRTNHTTTCQYLLSLTWTNHMYISSEVALFTLFHPLWIGLLRPKVYMSFINFVSATLLLNSSVCKILGGSLSHSHCIYGVTQSSDTGINDKCANELHILLANEHDNYIIYSIIANTTQLLVYFSCSIGRYRFYFRAGQNLALHLA